MDALVHAPVTLPRDYVLDVFSTKGMITSGEEKGG